MMLHPSAYPAMARHIVAQVANRLLREPVRKLFQRPPRLGPRRYIPPELGVPAFFDELRRRNTRYVVLRWFEQLPALDPGEDIDMLVADDDLPALAGLLTGDGTGGVPCDVYTASGLRGTAYKRLPYYPPRLAQQILDRAVWHPSGCKAPCPEHHFLSLSYHALYHKGPACGMPSILPGLRPTLAPEHAYTEVLAALAPTAGFDPACIVNMEALDRCLAERGWRPDRATLVRLAAFNPWVRQRFLAANGGRSH